MACRVLVPVVASTETGAALAVGAPGGAVGGGAIVTGAAGGGGDGRVRNEPAGFNLPADPLAGRGCYSTGTG